MAICSVSSMTLRRQNAPRMPNALVVHFKWTNSRMIGKQEEVIWFLPHLPTQEQSRNSEPLCNLAFGVWNLRLPQFNRISLRVMHAGEPAVRIRLRVHLDLDSSGL